MRIALIAFGVITLGGVAPFDREARAAETGHTASVRLSAEPPGLEQWLPREGRWGQAIDALHARELHRAMDLFRDAAADVRHAAVAGHVPAAEARALFAKAEFEAAQVRTLVEARRENSQTPPFEQLYIEASAWHNLLLTARAYFGRPDVIFYDRAKKAYVAALALANSDQRSAVQLAFASLLADGGHFQAARDELRAIPPADRSGLDVAFTAAHLYAALGDRDRAFDRLDLVRDLHARWSLLRFLARIDNDFDALRGDPRFVRLVGSDDDE